MDEVTRQRSVSILGATGSVGVSTCDLLRRHHGGYRVEAVTANSNVDALAKLARDINAEFAAISDDSLYGALCDALAGSGIACGAGAKALDEAAQRPADWVMSAIVGAAGLSPTLSAIRRGALVALANKETLVCAGELVMAEARQHGSVILPVDSEHNAIHQVFDFDRPESVEKLILTASGGPFRLWSMEQMATATPAQAIAHPNWSMGDKISIDSATLMNKGLELIEACHLFPLGEDRVDVVVHSESIIHSLVAYVDGSVLAQLGSPDMRTPIAYTLAWPKRMAGPSPRLDLVQIANLSFEAPDIERFPALNLARQVQRTGGQAAAVLNAANEIAVRGFLDGSIKFLDIVAVVETTLDRMGTGSIGSLEEVSDVDARARRCAADLVSSLA